MTFFAIGSTTHFCTVLRMFNLFHQAVQTEDENITVMLLYIIFSSYLLTTRSVIVLQCIVK